MNIAELVTSIVAFVSAIGAVFVAIFKDKFSSKKELIKSEAKLDAIKSLARSHTIEPEKIATLVLDIIDEDGSKK